ncbi:MAG: diaminopimelate decarboxylase [Candidatus Aminicenantes bacterium]|nr:diaminopimelate decarboxylase [Candidatus Aminicenantes bacterium]NIM79749.1 diaminopimelate decarboxylase [Candidatus Aminicenantes bacterium]NIN19080.1 diaminopimelate decarboxylase [Candidatus Aminicenantes bacterium]NIN42982.1 diaminopimelate decarboxylase [Candidatus Aminicenantes bacterium]NIN85725.1 diaminopimelate decarboxylase [Candidatus Aminicenantes bacterium]
MKGEVTGSTLKEADLFLEGEVLVNMAKKYGTPLYVYDGNLIIRRFRELHNFIKWPKLRILYAMKANYNIAILKLLKDHGAYIDTVSPAEVHLVLKLGYLPGHILYTANNITDEEMHEVKKTGVLMNIGSLSRLEKYGKAYPETEICLRFNPDVTAGIHEYVRTGGDLTKFGILMQDLPAVKKITDKYHLKVIGLHEHTGSGIAETEKVYQSMKNLLGIAKREDFPDLRFIDFGGGFKVPYSPDEKRINYDQFGKKIAEIFSEFCQEYGNELEMYFEPGKYLVAEAGSLVVQVNTLKDNKGRLIAGTDSGFPHLIRPVVYGAYHEIQNLSNPFKPGTVIKKYDICGNICETGDCFATQRDLPEIKEGDFLAVKNSGAYCYSMGGIYNLRAMPNEVLILNGRDYLVTKRLANEELAESIINGSRKF